MWRHKIQHHAYIFLRAIVALSYFFVLPSHAVDNYRMADFKKVEKIDVHTHIHNRDADEFIKSLQKHNIKILTINTDYKDFPSLAQQEAVAIDLYKKYPDLVAFAGTFSVENFNTTNWITTSQQQIDKLVNAGAVGIKIWKNVGMELKDQDGKLIMLDDKRLEPVINHLAKNAIPLFNHTGEPKNCWLPVSQMTVLNDQEYFTNHPQYHMYLHPELPGYDDYLAARDRLLSAHTDIKFVGVHLASLEWDVDELAKFLDKFPNTSVDLAARIGQLQFQSNRNHEKVREFFIRYQDRLMYGTDLSQSGQQTIAEFNKDAYRVWRRDWRYFNTRQIIHVPELTEPVEGLALPKVVVDKLYSQNARKYFPSAWKK